MSQFALAPAPQRPNTTWLIDVGPFFDRFGAAKMAVLTSSSATAKAIVQDCQIRKWIDLKNPAVVAAIDALIAENIPGLNAALKAQILNTQPSAEENMALRKLYFEG